MGSYLSKDPRGTARYVAVASLQVSLPTRLCGGAARATEAGRRFEDRERRKAASEEFYGRLGRMKGLSLFRRSF